MREQLLLAIACFISLPVSAEFRLIRRNSLQDLEKATIYSIAMDQSDAMWINSSQGLLRYNGSFLYKLQDPLPMYDIHFDGKDRIYALSDTCIVSYHTSTLNESRINLPPSDTVVSALCAGKEGLWISRGSGLWHCPKGETVPHKITSLQGGQPIKTMQLDEEGRLWIISGNSILKLKGQNPGCVLKLPSDDAIRLYFSNDGSLWVGYKTGGVAVYDRQGTLKREYHINGSNFRTFCESDEGFYIGSESELTFIDTTGQVWSPAVGTPEHQPVTSLAKSRNGQLWAGTFYSGIYKIFEENGSLRNLRYPDKLRNFKAVTQSAENEFVFLTDGNGAWRYNEDGFQLISHSERIKFQCGLYVPDDQCLYTGLYRQGMIAMQPGSEYRFTSPVSLRNSINDILNYDGKLWCATESGVIALGHQNDHWEEVLHSQSERQMISLSMDNQGNLWAAGDGLYVIRMNKEDILMREGNYTAVFCDSDCVWAAELGKGVWQLRASRATLWNDTNCDLADNFVTSISPLDSNSVILTTRSGFSVLNHENGSCRNYSNENGLVMSSARNGSVVRTGDGKFLICGLDGAAILNPDKFRPAASTVVPSIDFIHLQKRDIHIWPGQPVILSHHDNSLRIEFSNFDYKEEANGNFEYSFSSSGDDWHKADLFIPLSMVNLHPGEYTIRSRYPGSSEILTFSFKIRPPWYASIPAYLIYLLLLSIAGWHLSRLIYSRLLLTHQLREKERENEKWKNLLMKLSHELRTPISTISGNLELYLEKYGKSMMGVSYLKKAWNGTADMGKVLSSLLEIEDTDLIKFDNLPSYGTIPPIQFIPKAHSMLIADDNPEILAMLEDIFSEEYTLLLAKDGKTAYNMAIKSQPDLIISDILMPEMDGLALCSALRAEYATRHIPIILLTAHAAERNLIEGLNAGADDYVAKPFSVEILRAKCHSLIRTREALKERITPAPKSKPAPFLNAAISSVERHLYDKDLNVGTLCRELNVSKTTLNRRLGDLAGMSPRDFIEDIKLKYAATMLLKENSRVSEISDRLNFSSQKYFTQRFKKKFGETPSTYIKGQN
ncbi:MAG: response regulator [Bacteroidales bacterium]|nr:response regulator [Bacteroidales bacterium]